MAFDLFEHVLMIEKNIFGIIVHITDDDEGNPLYIVEGDEIENTSGEYPFYLCHENELKLC